MNALTRPYRVDVRPLHLESLDSFSARLLTQNQECLAQRQHLVRLARTGGETGTDARLWASIVEAKTGRKLAAETTPDIQSVASRATRSIGGSSTRYLCTRCSNGNTVVQLPHFDMNVCLKHNRWVGPGTTPASQLTTSAVIASAERKFRKLRASTSLTPGQYGMLHRCLQPLRDRSKLSSPAHLDAEAYPTLIRLATLIGSEDFSKEFFNPARSFANAHRFLTEQVAPHLPHSRRKVTRLLWLSFRSTILSIRETLDGNASASRDDDFAVHPHVASRFTRPIGPYESFAAYLVPTGDDRIDPRTADRPDSYDKLKNICRAGHRLTKPLVRTLASARNGTDNCPVCMHRELRTGVNDMATTHPWLAAQLHPTENGTITPRNIFTNTHTKLVWKCGKDDRHVYQATGSNRAAAGSTCSVCLNRVIIIGVNDLPTLFAAVAEEWHPSKNGQLSVQAVASGSNKIAWWLCPSGHTYRMTIGNRTRGAGCHFCEGTRDHSRCLSIARPDLAAEMHRTKNGNMTPDKVTIGSKKDIFWHCPVGHDYMQRPERRNAGYGCPICSGRKLQVGVNDIQTRYPEISSEWHSWKNGAIEPCDLVPGNRKFWWKCSAAEHVHEQNVPHRVETGGCPLCEPADRIAHNIAR